jgi:hypothetical protein
MIIPIPRLALAVALAIGAAGTAFADPGEPALEPVAERQEPLFEDKTVADDEALGRSTAREDLSIAAQSKQASTVSQSSVSGVTTTGELSIADNAFQNASGLTVINANTGNNVAMNASLNVTIVMTGPQ